MIRMGQFMESSTIFSHRLKIMTIALYNYTDHTSFNYYTIIILYQSECKLVSNCSHNLDIASSSS